MKNLFASTLLTLSTLAFPIIPTPVKASDSHLPTFIPVIHPIYYDNYTGQTIMQLYISPVYDGNWGYDILRSMVLKDGWWYRFDFSNERGCQYDLKAVLADGTTRTISNFNACNSQRVPIQ